MLGTSWAIAFWSIRLCIASVAKNTGSMAKTIGSPTKQRGKILKKAGSMARETAPRQNQWATLQTGCFGEHGGKRPL